MKSILVILTFIFAGSAAFAQVPQHLNYQGRVSVEGVNFNGTGEFKFALVGPEENTSTPATAQPEIGGMGDGLGPRVLSITVTAAGSGYIDPPVVSINHPTATGATAHAVLNGSGGILEIIVDTDGVGQGYDNQTTVTLGAPPENLQRPTCWSNDGTGTFGSQPTNPVSIPVTNGLYSVALGNAALPNMNMFPENLFADHGELHLRVWFNDGTNDFQLLSPDQRLLTAPYAFVAANVPDGAITSAKIASGAVGIDQLANGAVGTGQLASGAVGAAQLADASISPAKLVAATPPAAGQALLFDGTQFNWASQGLTLPYSGSASSGGSVVSIQNNSNGAAIEATGTAGDGVRALTGGAGKSAVFGQTNAPATGQGVFGYGLFGATGVLGVSNSGDGVSGRTNGNGKTGVFGYAEGSDSSGLHGRSSLHHGLYAYTGSTDRAAIWADAPNGAEAIHGHSNGGDGVVGFTASAAKAGIFGFSDVGNGVVGHAHAAGKAGVHGWSDNEIGYGGHFSNTNDGVAVKADGHINVDGYVWATSNIISDRQIRSNQGCVISWDGETIFSTNSTGASCQKDLTVRGNINHYGAIHNLSDSRLKDIAGDYERGLADITRIHTIRYSFKPSEEMPSAGEPRVGVTAQELREVIPEAVKEGAYGKLMMSNEPVFWAMVNSIKELKAENDALKARLDAIEAKLK